MSEKQTVKKPRCHNCKHGSSQFKIANLTHLQCLHPKHEAGFLNGSLSAWDTLRVFNNTCGDHEFKERADVLTEIINH